MNEEVFTTMLNEAKQKYARTRVLSRLYRMASVSRLGVSRAHRGDAYRQ